MPPKNFDLIEIILWKVFTETIVMNFFSPLFLNWYNTANALKKEYFPNALLHNPVMVNMNLTLITFFVFLFVVTAQQGTYRPTDEKFYFVNSICLVSDWLLWASVSYRLIPDGPSRLVCWRDTYLQRQKSHCIFVATNAWRWS